MNNTLAVGMETAIHTGHWQTYLVNVCYTDCIQSIWERRQIKGGENKSKVGSIFPHPRLFKSHYHFITIIWYAYYNKIHVCTCTLTYF